MNINNYYNTVGPSIRDTPPTTSLYEGVHYSGTVKGGHPTVGSAISNIYSNRTVKNLIKMSVGLPLPP